MYAVNKTWQMGMTMVINERTRIAVLGTLAEFHSEAIPFDMIALSELVANINPDLLCLDITSRQWRERDFNKLPPEYRDALLPLALQTDIVVAPIGGENPIPNQVIGGWRLVVINRLRGWISALQRTAPGPDAMNQGWRHRLTNYFYDAIRTLSAGYKKRGGADYVDHLVQKVIEVSQQDPGSRVLVILNVQHCHMVRRRLHNRNDLLVTNYSEL